MRTLVVLVIILFLLIGIGSLSDPVDVSADHTPSGDLGSAFVELAASSASLFVAVDDAGHEIDDAVHRGSRVVRAVFGCLRCTSGLLALIGLFALTSLRRAARRFLP